MAASATTRRPPQSSKPPSANRTLAAVDAFQLAPPHGLPLLFLRGGRNRLAAAIHHRLVALGMIGASGREISLSANDCVHWDVPLRRQA